MTVVWQLEAQIRQWEAHFAARVGALEAHVNEDGSTGFEALSVLSEAAESY